MRRFLCWLGLHPWQEFVPDGKWIPRRTCMTPGCYRREMWWPLHTQWTEVE